MADYGIIRHKDALGDIGTALTGTTQWTNRAYRTTGMVFPHIAQGDVFWHKVQLNHDKALGINLDGVHMHYIPLASANGDIKLDFEWGWYNIGDTIPATLPNADSVVIPLLTTDQYKLKIGNIVANMAHPGTETYSSAFFIKVTRGTPVGTNWGATNEIAIVFIDVHYETDRRGSVLEISDI